MKVLLLQDVKNVGRKMEIKEVSDGYARNFLIVRKLAVPADARAMKLKEDAEVKEKTLLTNYQELAKKLAGEHLEFQVKTGPKGEVFGSVKAEDIQKALTEKGYGEVAVELEKPLRKLGNDEVGIKFGMGIAGKVRVHLRA